MAWVSVGDMMEDVRKSTNGSYYPPRECLAVPPNPGFFGVGGGAANCAGVGRGADTV
jgi:hypothetical protein